MMILLIECIGICLFLYILNIISYKNNPLSGIHNLPIKIQERVQKLPEYKDIKPKRILSTKERIIKKIPALIVAFVIWGSFVYLAGARTFTRGFIYSFTLWVSVKIY